MAKPEEIGLKIRKVIIADPYLARDSTYAIEVGKTPSPNGTINRTEDPVSQIIQYFQPKSGISVVEVYVQNPNERSEDVMWNRFVGINVKIEYDTIPTP